VEEGSLSCAPCERSYPIRNGVAHFLSPQELEGLNRRFARFYDWVSPVYTLSTRVGFLAMGGERQARMEVLDRLDMRGGRVLEISIGSGPNLPYLFESPDVGQVYGLDISAGQLARCRRLVNQRGWSVDLFLGMAEALPFQPDAFDSVFHIGGINFFSGKQKAIEEMIRIARPGSKIVIADETERVARYFDRLPGLSRSRQGQKAEAAVPVHLVPDTMEEVQVDDIWEAHGQPHGYCLEFRKPS
jgi:ubiquinone/menaquinone biosynthesis C-methylase UbiE